MAIAMVEVVMIGSFVLTGLWWLGVLAAAGLAATGALFGWLTVSVDERAIVLRFGIGVVCKRSAIAEVVRATRVRNPWWTGWGIRWLPGRTVYNVSGFDAVEVELADGRVYRIGTDEPAALLAAIETGRAIGG